MHVAGRCLIHVNNDISDLNFRQVLPISSHLFSNNRKTADPPNLAAIKTALDMKEWGSMETIFTGSSSTICLNLGEERTKI